MKMPFSWACRVAGASVIVLLHGAARADLPAETAQRLMQQTGATAFLGQVSASVQAYLVAAVDADPAGAAKRAQLLPLSQSLLRAYAPERLRGQVAQSLARQLTPEEAAQAQAWLTSPSGQQAVTAENQSVNASEDARQNLAAAVKALGELSPERRALVADVVNATQVPLMQTEVLLHSLQAIHKGTAGFMPQAAKVSAKDLKGRLDAQRPELLAAYQSAGVALGARFYAGLSDAQLADYRAFLLSPVGERLRAVLQQSVSAALKAATEEAQRTIEVGAVGTPAGMPKP